MKKIVLLIFAALAFCISGEPKRGISAADGIEGIDEEPWNPTAADYIQDGLVAMWDGIENVGWGVHDNDAAVWKDLVTGIELISQGGHLWTGKSCNVHEIWSCQDLTDMAYLQANFLDNPKTNGGSYTVEVVTSTYSGGSKNIFGERFSSINIFTFGSSPRTAVCAWLGNGSNTESELPCNTPGTASFLCINNGSSWGNIGYANGAYRTSKTRSTYRGNFSRKYFGIGCGEYMSWGVAEGDYYCIRFYSRALSYEEIRYNYLIDKMRFGL